MPAGITIKAGPGNTIMAMPMKSTVKPTIAIVSLFACLIFLSKSAVLKEGSQ